MTQIAERAGVNKERLYSYFGDKHALWDAVPNAELDRLAAAVAMTGVGLEDIGEFAGVTYDFTPYTLGSAGCCNGRGSLAAHPQPAHRELRTIQREIEQFAAAQRHGVLDNFLDPDHIVFAIIALAACWQTVPQLAEMITGASSDNQAERARRRGFVVEIARRMAAPTPD